MVEHSSRQGRAGFHRADYLILVGVAFLLDSLHIIDFWAFERFWPVLWPVLLIVLGAYALYSRLTDRPAVPPAVPTDGPVAGVRHE